MAGQQEDFPHSQNHSGPQKTIQEHQITPRHSKKYIQKELSKRTVMGPYKNIPFDRWTGISPLSTRAKKESEDRRVMLDLSFPVGSSVIDGKGKDQYLGFSAKLTFPKTDELTFRIFQLGTRAAMFKIDLSRYFRQLPLDPGDYSLIGYIIDGKIYFDKVLPMGMRSAPYIAQRVSNAIAYIHRQMEFFILNYVNDFVGAEDREIIWQAYQFLVQLLEDLKVETTPEQVTPPTTRLEFLGITFDSQSMTMEIPRSKMELIQEELQSWIYKTKAKRREAESLIGKLQFLSKCIHAGRVFISRLINWIRGMDRTSSYSIPIEIRKDIAWWARFACQYNGISLMWLTKDPSADSVIATDACKTGYGGILHGELEYFRGRFPKEWQKRNIAELELRAVMVALKLWAKNLTGKHFWILVDNEAVASILNTGASRDQYLQDILREVALISATYQFVIKAKHISGASNRLPDWLSRWDQMTARKQFRTATRDGGGNTGG